MNTLNAITPIDGRYLNQTQELSKYFSEEALIKNRILIEVHYLLFLFKYKVLNFNLTGDEINYILGLYSYYNHNYSIRIKEIESKIKHDVKAIEYFIKEKLDEVNSLKEKKMSIYVHLGLTSQDINSTANILSIRDSLSNVLIPKLHIIFNTILNFANKWESIPILSHTHGQPASPSLLGKEFLVYLERLNNELTNLYYIKYRSKFGGAVGNLNSLSFALPEIDWIEFSDSFMKLFGLERNKYTTQIDHYDNYSIIFDNIKRINNILIDLCQDIWQYISMKYFCLKIIKDEVGSSAMPHKVNPINFENAEGNLLMANNNLNFLSDKLQRSRLQRDLTDSTILRNIGVAFSYSLIGYDSLLKGLNKIEVDEYKLAKDLDQNYVVVVEAIQTRLKVLGIHDSYEKIKHITRKNNTVYNMNNKLSKYIETLDISEEEKDKLKKLEPKDYTGVVPKHNFIEFDI